MSGLSYRHLKTLPEDLHKATYQMLCTLWPTQHIPDFWKQRWLVPLPKTTELSNIEDLRPICLLEIFRKLWTSILTHRIRGAWETHDMLDPSQHGFRAKHGTDSASLLLVDALEHAKETHSACFVSSSGTSDLHSTASANPLYKWPGLNWESPRNWPHS